VEKEETRPGIDKICEKSSQRAVYRMDIFQKKYIWYLRLEKLTKTTISSGQPVGAML